MAGTNYIIGVVAMEIIELVKHFMSMRAGWVVLVIFLLFFLLLAYGILRSASEADRLEEEMLCKDKKNAGKKRKFTAASLAIFGLSLSGMPGNNQSSEIAKPLPSQMTPKEISGHMELMKWKKIRYNNKKKHLPSPRKIRREINRSS